MDAKHFSHIFINLSVSISLFINEEVTNISINGLMEKNETHAKQKPLWIGWRAGFKLYWSLETIKIARVLVEGKEGFIPVV